MDVKSSPTGYPAATGTEGAVAPYEDSVRLLRESGIPHEFRTTAVKGIHTAADFEAIGEWLAGDDTAYFIQRFVDSGQLLGSGCGAFSHEETEELLAIVKPYIPRAAIRG